MKYQITISLAISLYFIGFLNAQNIIYPANYDELDNTQIEEFAKKIAKNHHYLKNLNLQMRLKNARAFELYAIILEKGFNTPKNLNKSRQYLLKSASLKYGRANYKLAMAYYQGDNITKVDVSKALHYLNIASDDEFEQATITLAKWMRDGENIPKNHTKARQYLQKKHLNNNGEAQYYLALMNYNGEGGIRDSKKAQELWHKSQSLGYIDAKTALAQYFNQ